MKTAKRVLAVMIAVIMIVGTCAVAASAATTLQAKIDEEERKVGELKNKLDAPFDEEYIIELAKEKLHLRLPEEIIFYTDN